MAKAGKILIALLLALLVACSTQYNEVAPDTVLNVTVVNGTTNVPIKGATVYLYDNATAFNQTIASIALPSGYVASFPTSDSGRVVIPKLKTNTQYYIYAYFQDTSIIRGTYITLDNSTKQYVLKNNLVQGSVTSILIPVSPSDGFILFWTQNSNSPALPIDAYIGSTAVGTISQGNAAPAPFQAGSVSARARAGKATVEGKSTSGCIWTNQVGVTAGAFSYYQLTDCSLGTIAFYADNLNAGALPIQVTLNANDGIGTISAAVTAVPTDCSAPNMITAARVPGNYTYQASSTSGNCLWNGTFTLTAGTCNIIYLSPCN